MLQIIGTKKCKETAKAIRFCKERNLAFQFVDLGQRTLSDGEWKSLFLQHAPLSFLDEESALYKKGGYAYRVFDPAEELMEHPDLLKTPILRSKNQVQIGFSDDVLAAWGSF